MNETTTKRRSYAREDLIIRGLLVQREHVERDVPKRPASLEMDRLAHESAERSMCAPFGSDAKAYAAGYPMAMRWLTSKRRAARIAADAWKRLESELPKREELPPDGELVWRHGEAPLARFDANGHPVWLHEDLAAYWREQTEVAQGKEGADVFPCIRCLTMLEKVRLWPGLGCPVCIADYDRLVGRAR